jgi:SMC interacting uncharacterized protein involved in chromosome segregation
MPGLAEAALSQIRGLYTAERELREKLRNNTINTEAFEQQRRARCEPILRTFHERLEENRKIVAPSSKRGEAINYTLSEWRA